MNKLFKAVVGAFVVVAMSITPMYAQSTNLNYIHRVQFHITSATTTTVVSSDAYIASIVISTSAVGTAFVCKAQNKEGTPKILIPALAASAVGTQTLLAGGGREGAILSKGGIDLVSTGTPGVIDVFITYWN